MKNNKLISIQGPCRRSRYNIACFLRLYTSLETERVCAGRAFQTFLLSVLCMLFLIWYAFSSKMSQKFTDNRRDERNGEQ